MRSKSQKVRFIIVGGLNTAIDFGLLFLLKGLGLPAITANIISTTTAFCFSFFANKKYTFDTINTNVKREVILFTIVTLFGIWVLQTITISFVSSLLATAHLPDNLVLFVAKVLATAVSLTWNYVLYSKVVFKK